MPVCWALIGIRVEVSVGSAALLLPGIVPAASAIACIYAHICLQNAYLPYNDALFLKLCFLW